MPKQGEALQRKDLGVATITKFRIECYEGRNKPYVIEPWKGKGAEITEWFRNDSAIFSRRTRTEEATFLGFEENSRVYINDNLVHDKTMDLAKFSSDVDGNKFDVAKRLALLDVPNLKFGDRVILEILGCCSLVGVKKK